ncbi:MAG: thioredoxin family protein [Propionibacteriales bacterium]|nr:thioredoxin family protein [Propionibacteriales bacterium]
MSTGAWFLIATLVLALAFGLFRAVTDGRFRGTHQVRGGADDPASGPVASGSLLGGTPWADQLGGSYTLLQFSSAFCAPCRATRRVLQDVATALPGVAHLEVDAEHHLDLVRALGILRTPTTVILDSTGAEITRATGAPTKQQVYAALGAL